MAVAITERRKFGVGRWFVGIFNVVFSGSYPGTNGDVADLRPFFPGNAVPDFVSISGSAGYQYDYVAGANLGVGKIRVGVNVGTTANLGLPEHTTAAYDAAVVADVVRMIVWVQKFG